MIILFKKQKEEALNYIKENKADLLVYSKVPEFCNKYVKKLFKELIKIDCNRTDMKRSYIDWYILYLEYELRIKPRKKH